MYTLINKDTIQLEKVAELFHTVWKNEGFEKIHSKTIWAFNNEFSKMLLYSDNGNLIAARGGIYWPLYDGDKELITIQFHGTCVHPDYRRKGLFTSINKEFLKDAKENGVEFIFNVSVDTSRKGYEKLGWSYIKGFRRLTFFRKPINLFFRKNTKMENVFLEDLEIDFDELDLFISARNNELKNKIHCKYSIDFLKWRTSNKNEGYKRVKTEDAFIIYKIKNTGGSKEVIIGEVFLLNYNFKFFKEVLNKLFKIEKPDVVYTYIFDGHPCYSFFLKMFFIPNPKRYNLNFGTKFIDPRLKNMIYNKEWAISFLDIDTF